MERVTPRRPCAHSDAIWFASKAASFGLWYTTPYAGKTSLPPKILYPDGAIREMVLWQLPRPTKDRPHGLKYRLYYGLADGTCVVRYDNETGKGDHRHKGDREESYDFTDVETLVADFLADIVRVRRGGA
jgi:hypothetical protein